MVVMASMAAQKITSQVFLGEKQLRSGYRSPVHWHDYVEVEIVLHGEVIHWHNGVRQVLHRGDGYVMTPSDFHALQAETDVQMLGLMIPPELLTPEIAHAMGSGSLCGTLTEPELAFAAQCAERAQSVAPDALLASLSICRCAEDVLLTVLQRCCVQPTGDSALLRSVLQILNTSFRESLTLASVAAQLAVSPNYLGSVIRQQSGCSFRRHLNRIRLKYACHLLCASDLTVKEVAFASGYGSSAYFLSVFKQMMHTVPTAWRADRARPGTRQENNVKPIPE